MVTASNKTPLTAAAFESYLIGSSSLKARVKYGRDGSDSLEAKVQLLRRLVGYVRGVLVWDGPSDRRVVRNASKKNPTTVTLSNFRSVTENGSYYAVGAAIALASPMLRVVAFAAAAAAASGHAAPLEAMASPAVLIDTAVSFVAAVALAVPLLAAADPAPRRLVGRVSVVGSAAVTLLLCPASVVFDRTTAAPAAMDLCSATAAASVRHQLASLASALVVTSLLSAAVLLMAPVPVAAVRCGAVAVVAIVLCLAASVINDWRAFPAVCHAGAAGGAAFALVSQLLRLGTVAVVLPLIVGSVAALAEAAAEDDDDDDDIKLL